MPSPPRRRSAAQPTQAIMPMRGGLLHAQPEKSVGSSRLLSAAAVRPSGVRPPAPQVSPVAPQCAACGPADAIARGVANVAVRAGVSADVGAGVRAGTNASTSRPMSSALIATGLVVAAGLAVVLVVAAAAPISVTAVPASKSSLAFSSFFRRFSAHARCLRK